MEHCISDAAGFLGGGGSTPSPTPTLTLPGWFYLDGTAGAVTNPIVFLEDVGDNVVNINIATSYLEDDNVDTALYLDTATGLVKETGTSWDDTASDTFIAVSEVLMSKYEVGPQASGMVDYENPSGELAPL